MGACNSDCIPSVMVLDIHAYVDRRAVTGVNNAIYIHQFRVRWSVCSSVPVTRGPKGRSTGRYFLAVVDDHVYVESGKYLYIGK